jgi:hypothetical protein
MRSVFVGALCTGVAMVAVSVNGLLGVDADLQRSAYAAQQRPVEPHSSVRVTFHSNCPAAPARDPKRRI